MWANIEELDRNWHKTQTLEAVLKREFSENFLFGRSSSFQQMPKVAVTSSSIFGEQPTIFANYNRSQDANQSQCFDDLELHSV